MLIFLFYGILELTRGLALGYSPVRAMQELVFNIYPLYFFIGLQAALTYPDVLPKVIRFLSLASCVWGLAYYLGVRNFSVIIPGTTVDLIMAPGGSGMALGGMTYLDLRRWWPVIVLSAFFVLSGQIRGGWAALGAGLVLQAMLTRTVRRLVFSAASMLVLLLIGYWTDVSLPSPAGRGGVVSSREIVARAVATVGRDAAAEISRKNAAFYAGTISWRQRWWRAIWKSVHKDTETALLGYGYGFPLNELVTYLHNREDMRTPHNVFFYALGYTGWIGVLVFSVFQTGLGVVVWRVFRATGQPFGIVFWLMAIISSMFGSVFETPMGAIPYYLMIGMAATSLVSISSWRNSRFPRNSYPQMTRGPYDGKRRREWGCGDQRRPAGSCPEKLELTLEKSAPLKETGKLRLGELG
jgi:hypothetical protein